ncbi:MAG: hypothetical protein WAO35_16070 [Terriglobia bacterium]
MAVHEWQSAKTGIAEVEPCPGNYFEDDGKDGFNANQNAGRSAVSWSLPMVRFGPEF